MENLRELIDELIRTRGECLWLEFKKNNFNPEMIGEDISAIANGAALEDRSCGYMIWGVDNDTRKLEGVKENFRKLRKGGTELENWLRQMLSRNADFEWGAVESEGRLVGVLKIAAAVGQPVTFQRNGFIRVGSYTKRLNEYPELEGRLWDKLRGGKFESRYAKEHLTISEALGLIDYVPYFDQRQLSVPSSIEETARILEDEGLVVREDSGRYAITNMGALMLGKRLSDFPGVERKVIRIVQYVGDDKFQIQRDVIVNKGYLSGFEEAMKFIRAVIPTRADIGEAFRQQETGYPLLAIREAVANAIIHQDFLLRGAGPTIEIFPSRIEISNLGLPLVDVLRIVDTTPKSRNEKLASFARRMNICEELGSGWDRIVSACELMQLPTPKIDLYEDSIKVVMYARIPFANLSNDSKMWSVYTHACIKYIGRDQLTNASLRKRFG